MSEPEGSNQGSTQPTPVGVPAGAGARPERKSIMRSLGEFFGHIAHAVRTDPASPAPGEPPPPVNRQVTRQTVEEEERQTPQGKVTLRRTIIEEVEMPRNEEGDGR